MNKLIELPGIEKPFISDVPEGFDPVKHYVPKPMDWSNYQPTGNNAIDLVAQFLGWCKAKHGFYPRQIVLKPAYYKLFFAGIEVLKGEELDPITQLSWEKVPIIEGSYRQFDSLVPIWR